MTEQVSRSRAATQHERILAVSFEVSEAPQRSATHRFRVIGNGRRGALIERHEFPRVWP